MCLTPLLPCRIHQHQILCGSLRVQNAATLFPGKYRLDAAGNIAGEQADRPGRRDGKQVAVADAVAGNGATDVLRQLPDEPAGEVGIRLECGKRTFFPRQVTGTAIGRQTDALHDAGGRLPRGFTAVMQAQHQQGVGEAGQTEADASHGPRHGSLCRQRIARTVDHGVEKAHGQCRSLCQRSEVQMCRRREGSAHEARQHQ